MNAQTAADAPAKINAQGAKGNKRLYVSKNFIDHRQISYENIMSETGILYRMNRSIQVEGAFGVLKNDYEFQRFLLRGVSFKTSIEIRHKNEPLLKYAKSQGKISKIEVSYGFYFHKRKSAAP